MTGGGGSDVQLPIITEAALREAKSEVEKRRELNKVAVIDAARAARMRRGRASLVRGGVYSGVGVRV